MIFLESAGAEGLDFLTFSKLFFTFIHNNFEFINGRKFSLRKNASNRGEFRFREPKDARSDARLVQRQEDRLAKY